MSRVQMNNSWREFIFQFRVWNVKYKGKGENFIVLIVFITRSHPRQGCCNKSQQLCMKPKTFSQFLWSPHIQTSPHADRGTTLLPPKPIVFLSYCHLKFKYNASLSLPKHKILTLWQIFPAWCPIRLISHRRSPPGSHQKHNDIHFPILRTINLWTEDFFENENLNMGQHFLLILNCILNSPRLKQKSQLTYC